MPTRGVDALVPYVPGKNPLQVMRSHGVTDPVRLASNENPYGCTPLVRETLVARLAEVSRYPDSTGHALKSRLVAHHGGRIGTDQIVLGNGSNELFHLCAMAFVGAGQEVVFSEYAFFIFSVVAHAHKAKPIRVPACDWGHDLPAMAAATGADTACVFMANPNNPTGTWVDERTLGGFLDAVPKQVLVVVDEAYFEYVTESGYPDSVAWIARYPNLVVTRTFSKMYGLAGMRVAYAITNPRIAATLERVREAFNVNCLAQHAACAALDDTDHVARSRAGNSEVRAVLVGELQARGYACLPSPGNFVTFDCGGPAGPVFEALLQKGVIVRTLEEYGMPDHVRVSVGRADEIERFLVALPDDASLGRAC